MKNFLIKSAALAALTVISAVSCTKEQNVDSSVSQPELHFIIKTAENTPVKSFIENNLDGTGTYTPKWTKGDELALFIGTISDKTSSPTATLSNTAETGTTASFDGTVPTDLTNGSFLSFSPAGAFAKGYTDGTVGINLSEIQTPSSLTIDEACDVLVAKLCDFTAENGTVAIDDLFFKRIFSIVKVNLKGAEALNGEKVTSFTLNAPATLTGRAAVDLSTASLSKWNIENQSVTANYSEDCPVFGGANGLNTIWLVVNPTTVANRSTVTFSGETENYTFSKEVNLSKDLVFPQSQMAVINLSIGEDNYTSKTAETRIFVEGFDKVETTKTQLQPSVTGALGTGVTEALAYTYSSKNTNLRFNNNGHSSTNPYLYISAANDNLIISNIKISGETALKFSYQAKTNSGSSTITINYKESSSDVWTKVGTSTAETGTFDTVNAKVFNVSSEATSIDIQIVGSAAALVDDLVLESFSEGGSETVKLAAPTVSCTAQTETSLTFSWEADSNASGYQVSTDGGSTYGDTQTATTYTWEGLTASTSYTLYVKAIGDGTNYTDSDAATATGTTTSGGSTGGATPTEKTVFLETFGSTTSTPAFNEYTGYSATAEMFTTSGDVNTHYSGSGKIGKNNLKGVNLSSEYTGASGLSGCYHTGTANTEATILQISDINITDCVNISVSFGALGGSSSHIVSVYYTIDGGAETALITDGAITNAKWTLLNANILGTGKSLTLIFKHTPTKAWTIRMDDIKVVGTK